MAYPKQRVPDSRRYSEADWQDSSDDVWLKCAILQVKCRPEKSSRPISVPLHGSSSFPSRDEKMQKHLFRCWTFMELQAISFESADKAAVDDADWKEKKKNSVTRNWILTLWSDTSFYLFRLLKCRTCGIVNISIKYTEKTKREALSAYAVCLCVRPSSCLYTRSIVSAKWACRIVKMSHNLFWILLCNLYPFSILAF